MGNRQSHSVCLALQIFNMSSGLASMGNLAANLKGEGIYQFAASYGLAYRASKAALCMGKPCHQGHEHVLLLLRNPFPIMYVDTVPEAATLDHCRGLSLSFAIICWHTHQQCAESPCTRSSRAVSHVRSRLIAVFFMLAYVSSQKACTLCGVWQPAASKISHSSDISWIAETLSLAADLKPEGITVVSMDPGWVRTDMGGPIADIEAPESIAGQLKVYDAVTVEDTGKFYKYDGSIVPF